MKKLEYKLFSWLLDRIMRRYMNEDGTMQNVQLLTKHHYLWLTNGGIRKKK